MISSASFFDCHPSPQAEDLLLSSSLLLSLPVLCFVIPQRSVGICGGLAFAIA
jgi:hypothetical protein